MILYLKKIKYFIKNNKFIGHFFLIIKLLINGKIILNFFFSSKFPNIGKFKTKINIFDFEEIKILNNKYYDHPNLQSFRNLNLKKTNLYVFTKNELLKKFLSKTLNLKIIEFTKKTKINNKKVSKNVLIADEISALQRDNYKNLNKINLIYTNDNTNNIIKDYFKYSFNQGRILHNKTETPYYYKLYSKKKININTNSRNKISGFSTIKSFDIYPFDLAYESIMPYVDEFILGIDNSSFNKKYEKLLSNYLNKSKYRSKIKCHFFDFNSETTLKIKVRGRWITDANNKMINLCNEKYCLYVQADEIFPKIKKNFFIEMFKNQPDEIYFNFLHFVFNLETIIDPDKSSYNEAIRIFRKDLYAASHDGFSFHNLTNYRPKRFDANYSINHISYVYKYHKKINEHFEKKDGLHINQSSKTNFLKNYVIPKKVNNIKKNLRHFKYLNSFKFIN